MKVVDTADGLACNSHLEKAKTGLADLSAEEQGAHPKVVIVGAVAVGTTFAYSLLIRGLVAQIVLLDINKDKAEGEAMDLNHGLPFAHPVKITVGDYHDCKDADIVVITVDKGEKVHESRLALAGGNFAILKDIIGRITSYNKDCILLVVTNPLDAMTYAALKLSKFPRSRVIGSGTALDTARLRFLLSEHLKVDPRNVHAYIIGEHGDSEVPVWSLANVAGMQLKDYCPVCEGCFSQKEFNGLFSETRNAAYEIVNRKGRTYYAVALAMTRIVESIVRNENAVLTVSCFLEDYHGVSDICLSVPAVLNRNGIRETVKLPLTKKEVSNFRKSADIVRKVNESLGL